MRANEDDGKAYLPNNRALVGYPFNTLDGAGLAHSVMSRQRALQLLGGTIVGTWLGFTVEPRSAAAVWGEVKPILQNIATIGGALTFVVGPYAVDMLRRKAI